MADDDLDEDELDDEDEDEDEDEEGSSGGGSKKLIIIVAAVLLLLIGGGAAAFFMGLLDPLLGMEGKAEGKEGEHAATGEGGEGAAAGAAVFYDLPEMLVNLNTGDRKATFLKIKVSLEVPSPAEIPKLQALMPRIIDNFQVYLRELRIDDLKGSAGIYRLREELLMRVNAAIAPAKVNAVLFKEMLVQ